jgi:hypothetical protein
MHSRSSLYRYGARHARFIPYVFDLNFMQGGFVQHHGSTTPEPRPPAHKFIGLHAEGQSPCESQPDNEFTQDRFKALTSSIFLHIIYKETDTADKFRTPQANDFIVSATDSFERYRCEL